MRVFVSAIVATFFLVVLFSLLPVQAMPPRCVDITDPTASESTCGCTWGHVYYQGEPVAGAVVSLTFNSETVSYTTSLTDTDNMVFHSPIYHLSARQMDARRGDMMLLTASYLGKTISKTIRAVPDPVEKTQEVNLIFPYPDFNSVSTPMLSSFEQYAQTMSVISQTAWLGGQAGVMKYDLSTGMSITYTLPPIIGLTTLGNDLWAMSANAIHQWNGMEWITTTSPLSLPLVVMKSDSADKIAIVGRDSQNSEIAIWENRQWSAPIPFSSTLITALAYDDDGFLWVGSDGDGIYRQTENGWINYTTNTTNGLLSNTVRAIVVRDRGLFFGTAPVYSSSSSSYSGGIGRYHLDTDKWMVYTIANGLLPDRLFPSTPMNVAQLTVTADGTIFALQGNNLLRFAEPDKWKPELTLPTAASVKGLEATDKLFVLSDQLYQFEVEPLTMNVQIESATWSSDVAKLRGSVQSSTTATESFVNAVWKTEDDAIICYGISCTATILTHTVDYSITLSVQHTSGQWATSERFSLPALPPSPTAVSILQSGIPVVSDAWSIILLSLLLLVGLGYKLAIRPKNR